MWLLLLRTFWPMIPAFALSWMLHSADVTHLKAEQKAALQTQVAADMRQCNADKQLTENISNDYERKINDLNAQLARARSMRPRSCIVPLPSALSAARFNAAAPASRRTAVAHGITSEALLSYEGACKATGFQVDGLQDFIRKTWAANSQ